jgi:hypothetical protein
MRRAMEEAGIGYVLAVPKSQHLHGPFSRIDQAVADAPEGMGTPLLRRQLARSAMTEHTVCTIGKTRSSTARTITSTGAVRTMAPWTNTNPLLGFFTDARV